MKKLKAVSIVSRILSSVLKVQRSEDLESANTNTVEYDPVPPIPVYSKEHVDHLRKIFPKKSWSLSTTVEELAFNAGQQTVIDNIEGRLKQEIKKVLK